MKSPDTPIAKKGFFVTHFLTVKADALFNAAVAQFSRPRVVEFIGVLGYNSMLAIYMRVFSVEGLNGFKFSF